MVTAYQVVDFSIAKLTPAGEDSSATLSEIENRNPPWAKDNYSYLKTGLRKRGLQIATVRVIPR